MKNITALFEAGRYRHYLAVSHSLAQSDRTDAIRLDEALCYLRLGKLNQAMSLLRELYENAQEPETRQNALLNLAMCAVRNLDLEFADRCFEEALRTNDGELWQARIYQQCRRLIGAGNQDRLLDEYSALQDAGQKVFFHNQLSRIAKAVDRIDLIGAFYIELRGRKEVPSIRLMMVAFEHFRLSDNQSEMARILDDTNRHAASRSDALYRDYMELLYLLHIGDCEDRQFQLATQLISQLDNSPIIHGESIEQACATVLKRHSPTDPVLVSTRFGLVGISKEIGDLRDGIARFASLASPVLITGESGTGKELTARALHEASDRSREPFVVVNCPAIPDRLFESELFGHVAGSFTGASYDRAGKIEEAGAGTLFLDEVGDLEAGMQAKLLRFLESGEYQRIGEGKVRYSKARIIAASHKRLSDESFFRHDLYQRICSLELHLPSLEKRREDIRYLARHRVQQLNASEQDGWKELSPDAEELLFNTKWPGNVRQLFHLIDSVWHTSGPRIQQSKVAEAIARRAVPVSNGSVDVQFSNGQSWLLDFKDDGLRMKDLQERVAYDAVIQGLKHFDGNVSQVADYFQLSSRSIYRMLERGREMNGDNA
jgi:DNA-binding NtrC family response regulator